MAETKKADEKSALRLRKTALGITRWVGSLQSILVHTALFGVSFAAVAFGLLPFERMLLVLTTVVSLEAIYLSIFIQMTINYTTATIEEVGEDIDALQEDIEEIQEDVGEIQEDVGEIQEDVDEIQHDVDELQEDVEEMTEDEKAEEMLHQGQAEALNEIRAGLQKLMSEVDSLQRKKK